MRANPPGPSNMATSGTTGSGEPDMALVSELLEEVSRHPPAIAARKLLVEHYVSVGWLDAATDDIKDLKRLEPQDPDVIRLAQILERRPEPPAPEPVKRDRTSAKSTLIKAAPKSIKRKSQPPPQLSGNLDATRKDLTDGYQTLRAKAKFLLIDLLHLQNLQKKNGITPSKDTARIQAIVEGQKVDNSSRTGTPGSARATARLIQANQEKATELAIVDLEETMRWVREPNGKLSGADDDAVRDALVQRMHSLESALPEELRVHCELALMHVVHENLDKTYTNDETMLGDSVQDIPREEFYVTEDNFAWDMSELVQAITANGGVMRNPLSKQMFTPKDVKGILVHPQGRQLAALQVQQHEMSKGVRPDTITHMEKLAKILLDDQSSDSMPSRHAIDEFLAYIATCKPTWSRRVVATLIVTVPELEQKAIDGFKCPATDSHTRQAYDSTIGEAVRDAKGNRVCFHKTGDFIKQAAVHLRKNQGVAADPDKCVIM